MTRRFALSLFALCAAGCAFALTAPPALATTEFHAFSTSFAGSGANALSEPTGVAVDQSTGDVYVADTADQRVEKFGPSGEFLLMFGKEVNKTKAEEFHEVGNPHRITEAEENLCAEADPGECQSGKAAATPGAFREPSFLAVDNSPDGEGDVYVGTSGGGDFVSKFDSAGALISDWKDHGQLLGESPLWGIAVDPFGNLFVISHDEISNGSWLEQDGTRHAGLRFPGGRATTGLAVDAEDHLYRVGDASRVLKFTDTGETLGEPDGREDSIGLAVDPSTNDLYVIQGGEGGFVDHYAFDCVQSPNCTPLDSFGQGHLVSPHSIAVDGESGAVYVTDPTAQRVDLFTPVPGATLTAAKTGTGSGTITSSPAGIGCGPACPAQAAEFAEGASLTLTATPTERSTFAAWTGCEEEPSPTECKVTIGTAKEVKAAFTAIPQQRLTVANPGTGVGAGTLTSTSPGPEFKEIDCGNGLSTCAETYNEGSTVILFATPDERSTTPIVWTGCPHELSETVCEVTMSAAQSVKAEFAARSQEQLTITTTEGTGAGTVTGTDPGSESEFKPIDCAHGTGTCEASYNEGSTLTLTATPAQDSVFSGWGEDECREQRGAGNDECEVEMAAARSVKADFAALPKATVNPPSSLTAVAATLSANLDPTGGEVTACRFEYTTGHEFEISRWNGANTQAECEPRPPYEASIALSATAAPLTSGTYYHDRVLLTNENGTSEAEGEFTTLARYRFSTDIGSPGSGDGQLQHPQGVALDNSTGDLYVADTANHRVVKFDSSGNFISTWGWGVSDGNAASETCVSACHAGIAGSAPGQFESPTYIAVDNSTGPSAGDVYVADPADDLVQKFSPEGHLITTWEDGGTRSYPAGISGIAVRSDGQLVVQPGSGSGIAIDPSGVVQPGPIAIDPATDFFYTDTGAEIERSTYHRLCNQAGECSVPPECNSAGAEDCPLTEFFGAGHLSSALALAFDPSTEVIYAANSGDGNIAVFTPIPLPKLTTGPVETPAPTSATLTGTVEPSAGEALTQCRFEFGETEAYGHTAECEPAAASIPASGKTSVNARIANLTPFATYHYRLVATDSAGQGLFRYGHDRTLLASPGLGPVIDATSSSAIAPTTATLGAEINPNQAPTIYRFRYGVTAAYGSQTPPSESIGEDATDHPVSAEITGLAPATTYHFQVIAVNLNGVTEGPDRTFTTPALPAVTESAASAVGPTTATLGALIRPGFRSTTYHFEYGTGSVYGHSTPQSPSLGPDNLSHPASATVTGLTPNTTYHFRILATNEIGTTPGPDQTFTTAPEPEMKATPPPTCHKGQVLKHGKCVKKPKAHKKHHKRGGHK